MAPEIRKGAAKVGDGIQDKDVRGRNNEVTASKPGEEVEETLKDGNRVGGRSLRKLSARVDGRDARLRGGLETGRRLERIAAAVVQETDVVVGPPRRLSPQGHLPAIANGQIGRYPPGLEVFKEVR